MQIKVCGLTRKCDVDFCVRLGINALGFILAESQRRVSLARVEELISDLPPFIDTVAVMVNPVCGELKEVVDSGLFSYIQFHGEEKPELLKGLAVKSIKAFSIEGGRDLDHIGDYQEVDYYLFDARTGQKRGGTGSSFDWDLLKGCSIDKPFILAGGLGPDNIVNALCKLRPAAVDLNSRVESEPGIKEHRFLRDTVMKIRRFERLLSLNEAKIRGNEDKLSGNEDNSGNEDKA